MTEEEKQWIYGASYEDLLSEWRFSHAGTQKLAGDAGKYFHKVMIAKKQNCDHVAISKRVGW
jgi:hypothetical protein